MFTWPKSNDVLGSVNRGNAIESGLCTLCRADCQGKCETWLSSLRGREMLYPRDFGMVTAGSGNTTHVGVSYNSLRIQGLNYGALGSKGTNGDHLFTDVSLETSFGAEEKTKCRVPFMTGALGSTFIAAKYWDSFAVGCALVGAPIVVGENVVGVDRESIIQNGRISSAPELDRRIETYMRYYDGYGAIIVQLNVEDTRNGVAEYVAEKYGDKVIIELKWGQGAKNIGGEIEVSSLEYALFLKKRGYLVDPDPEKAEVQEGFKRGAIHSFARHSRLGYTELNTYQQVHDDFMNSVVYLRKLGFKRISLKTGSYGMEALAMAIKFATEAKLDLLTMDGSGGGTGMSPWNMMESWGVPSILLHSKAHEYATRLAAKGERVVDMSFAGGFAKGSNIFKALAMGAPFTKMICMGRGMMIPGFLGANIEGVLNPERRTELSGNWDSLPASVSKYGKTAEEIFACYQDVEAKVGKDEMKNIPLGAVGIWCLVDKLSAGLQQLLAGARKFDLTGISRADIASANRETERETGIPFITDVMDDTAKKILDM
ncbi:MULTISPECIES: glutamate synthase-related protein [unclassified Pseudodesulfovibrio]|uniref:glutamate synthase-related protein n=1 Tax=unclassified Pseudodesulfovibrio TaxID=2661612 RepID=UPI000FEBCF61|nr:MULTISPECIES: glutamate synthase-related protein [unclassified Pseudodesulfovibrio]MCJ2165586.1 glutamate synthase-related protein [Pseudodesulfovibrio sp. S3-i]RWU02995.1 FMN-binding glutamate synthase family protein [Pseudodesulfovibrio sp. S3]